MAKFETSNIDIFKAEAASRGLQTVGEVEGDGFRALHVGIVQANAAAKGLHDAFIPIEYGVFASYISDGKVIATGIIFDTDEEFEDWAQEEIKRIFNSGKEQYGSNG